MPATRTPVTPTHRLQQATVTPTKTQMRVIDHASGPLLVVGGPGTGKTSTLVAAVAQRMSGCRLGGPQPLVLAHSRRAASDLRNAITRAMPNRTVQPQVMTVHALARNVVARFRPAEQGRLRLLRAPEQDFRVRELLASAESWPEEWRHAVGTSGFVRQARASLARVRHVGLDPSDLMQAAADTANPGWLRFGAFVEEYLDILGQERAADYPELIEQCRALLTDPGVVRAVAAQIDSVYVDDVIEWDDAQLQLLRTLWPAEGPFVAFGDPDQRVFGFRGASPRAVSFIRNLLADDVDRDVPVVYLHTDFRQSPRIALATQHVAQRLPLVPGVSIEARQRDPGAVENDGFVQAHTYPSSWQEARGIASYLQDAHLRRGRAWRDMAVIVRSGRGQFPQLVSALTSAGVPVSVAGDETALSSNDAVRPLLLALDIVSRNTGATDDEGRYLLTSPLGGLDGSGLLDLRSALRSVEVSPRAADGRQGGFGWALDDAALGAVLPDSPSVAAWRVVANALHEARLALAAGGSVTDVLWMLWQATPWPNDLRARARFGGSEGHRANGDLDAVCAVFDFAVDGDFPSGIPGVRAFLAAVHAQAIPADVEREAQLITDRVQVITAHRAKGGEWPVVVVAGVQEGVWPAVKQTSTLLDPSQITREGIGLPATLSEHLQDERRLFYLACTRAQEELVVTAVSGSEDESSQASRFISELGVDIQHQVVSTATPNSLDELACLLRRHAASPDCSDGVRLVAAARLAHLATLRDPQGRPLAPSADPGRWWGIASVTGSSASSIADVMPAAADPDERPAVRMSASELATLLECPLRFHLARRARIQTPRTNAAVIGSALHVIAQHAGDGMSLDEARSHLDAVWQHLSFDAEWVSRRERAEADAALARLLRWHQGRSGNALVGTEVAFECTVDVDGVSVTLHGSVDRLERDETGQLRIIDFKSGRTTPSRAAVASMPQLGFYQLAADSGAFAGLTDDTARSAGAELVYLRHGDGAGDHAKVFHQAALADRPHLDASDADWPSWAHRHLASASAQVLSGQFPARPSALCRTCAFSGSCPAQPQGRQVIA